MRNLAFILIFIGCFNQCNSETKKEKLIKSDPLLDAIAIPTDSDGKILKEQLASMLPLESVIDFGTLKEGAIKKHELRFVNIGNVNLLIANVSSSCGCTIPSWPKNFIIPGDTSAIIIEYNSTDKFGPQLKYITITANTDPANTIIEIKANVIKK